MTALLNKFRNRETIKMFDRNTKIFTTFQLNKKEKFICWERFISVDKINWVEQNRYLSLKQCLQIISKINVLQK